MWNEMNFYDRIYVTKWSDYRKCLEEGEMEKITVFSGKYES